MTSKVPLNTGFLSSDLVKGTRGASTGLGYPKKRGAVCLGSSMVMITGSGKGSRDEREAQDTEQVEVEIAMKESKNVNPNALGLYRHSPLVYRWRIRLLA